MQNLCELSLPYLTMVILRVGLLPSLAPSSAVLLPLSLLKKASYITLASYMHG